MSGMGRAKAGSSKPVLVAGTVRASVSFPREIHETLEKIAREKKVSLAWVVREATERYIADRWPLLVVPKGRLSGVDTLTRAQRSAVMSRVRSQNSRPEMFVRRLVFALGYRYRLHAPQTAFDHGLLETVFSLF